MVVYRHRFLLLLIAMVHSHNLRTQVVNQSAYASFVRGGNETVLCQWLMFLSC